MQQFHFLSLIEKTYTGASLILEKLFSWSGFYDIASFSVTASGPWLLLKKIFSKGPVLMLLYSIVNHLRR